MLERSLRSLSLAVTLHEYSDFRNSYSMYMHLVGKHPKKLEENKMFTNQRAENT